VSNKTHSFIHWTLFQLKQEYKKLVKISIVIFKNLSRSTTLQLSRQTYFICLPLQARIQIGMFRSIRVDHTNCLQVAINLNSFIHSFIHSPTARNMELPQLGEPRKVQPPSQRRWLTNIMPGHFGKQTWSLPQICGCLSN
jgi:hypothetical protein